MIDYIFTGGVADNNLPNEDFRVIVHESVTVIPRQAFYQNQNIVELICHAGVKKIEEDVFDSCRRLRRLIIPGVKIVEGGAFLRCEAVTYVECPMLEIIGQSAFNDCKSLSDINLPSAKVVDNTAFSNCQAMTDVKFGENLESMRWGAFMNCPSLKRITIPLKNGVIIYDYLFQGCENLERVDLIEGAILRDTVNALLLGVWRNDMNEEIDSINQILPDARAGVTDYNVPAWCNDEGEKAMVIREWIARVLQKVIRYKAEHRHTVNEASYILHFALPQDIVANNILPFLELPPHTFDAEQYDNGEENIEEDESSGNSDVSDDQSYFSSKEGDLEEEEADEEGEGDSDNNVKIEEQVEGSGDEVGDRKRRKMAN